MDLLNEHADWLVEPLGWLTLNNQIEGQMG